MNWYFGLIFYQSLILSVFHRLGQCERFRYQWDLDSVSIENTEEEWKSILLSKYLGSDKYTFSNDRLNQICDGVFSSSDVEIAEMFDKTIKLFLIRGTTNMLFIKVVFSAKNSVKQFLDDIRSLQGQEYSTAVYIKKFFQYQLSDPGNGEDPLKQLAAHIALSSKDLRTNWLTSAKSFSFLLYESGTKSEVHLILLSKTFNISKKLSPNKFVLCVATIPTHRFILYFHNYKQANEFYEFIKRDLDNNVPCLDDWVTHILT